MQTPSQSVYLSGPMSGVPDFNHPEFNEIAERWRTSGWYVINPAEVLNGETHHSRPMYMRRDIENLLTVDAIAMLPGWRNSQGARFELLVAQELGLRVFEADTMGPAHIPPVVTNV